MSEPNISEDSNIVDNNETVGQTTTTTSNTENKDNTVLEVDKETTETKEESSSSELNNHPATPLADPHHNPSTANSSDISSNDHDEAAPTTPKYTSVKDIGISTEKNPRFRRTMEDEHVSLDGFGGVPDQAYFAIYDGHGGRGAVDYTAKNLHLNLLKEIENDPENIQEDIKKSYLDTDEQMGNEPIQFSGTTTITALLRKNNDGEKHLYVANAGDARAVICKNAVAERLSYDHKGSDLEETKRIINAGGFVVNNRVNGILAVTRSLGDHSMKEYVIGDPYQRSIKLEEGHSHLILACDGLWDVVGDQEAIDIILKETGSNAKQMSEKLLLTALRKGSTDNISIMVMYQKRFKQRRYI
ncbi:protein phosphatase 2C-related protein [Cavenderia fasciculata]|uniref:Protein phosphatase 2C-related protein n=1 Tax=Cavenderia fasciculata TaxID=261658 RepID=F4Q934_CACFS|nr:protein phosphatase 2C-related protein [Cavenderia fasciculata]EGG15203.1 protein phosphatase 2C-related protein [Cavenderia fasciculata]|eukprot:XP_004351923.1 protein phosphatase 2C-related protein [Cavenderia fasciculata]